MDERTTIGDLRHLVDAFVSERDWTQFHSPKNLSMAIAVEAAELMDIFKWHSQSDSIELVNNGETRTAASEELADIIILCLAFGNRSGLDVAAAVERKVEKNRAKYPADKYRGRF